MRRMTIDRALKITHALKHHKDVCFDSRVWAAYYNLLEDALMQVKMDGGPTVGECCVDLIDYALEDDITFSDKAIPYCRCHRRHFPDLYHRHQYLQFHQGNHGLLCCGQ